MKMTLKLFALSLIMTLVTFGLTPLAQAQYQRAYRYNDNYMRQIFTRLETRTDRFSNRFMNNRRLDNRTEQAWVNVRNELNRLAKAYDGMVLKFWRY